MIARFLVSVGIALALLLSLFIGIKMTLYGNDSTESTPSYAAQNLEALKTVTPRDLIVCIQHSPTRIQHAFLIELNRDGQQLGRALDRNMVSSDQSYDLRSVIASCEEMQVVHPPLSFEVIGRIISYGLNSKPPAN